MSNFILLLFFPLPHYCFLGPLFVFFFWFILSPAEFMWGEGDSLQHMQVFRAHPVEHIATCNLICVWRVQLTFSVARSLDLFGFELLPTRSLHSPHGGVIMTVIVSRQHAAHGTHLAKISCQTPILFPHPYLSNITHLNSIISYSSPQCLLARSPKSERRSPSLRPSTWTF